MTWASGDSLSPSNLNTKSGIGYVLNPTGADDTSLIQAAMSSLSTGGFAAQRGGRVELSRGTWIVSSTLTIPPGVTLSGTGRESSAISYNGTGFAITAGVGTTENSKGVGLENLHISGNSLADGALQIGDSNFPANPLTDVRLSRLQINNFTKSDATAIYLVNPSHVHAELVHVYSVQSGTALHIDANGANTGLFHFDTCRFGGSSGFDVQRPLLMTSTSNVLDSINFNACFFRGTGVVIDIDNTFATNFWGCHLESSAATAMVRIKNWQGGQFVGGSLQGASAASLGFHILGTGSAKKLVIGTNWINNLHSAGTAVLITPPGAGAVQDILLLPNQFSTTAPVEVDDTSGFATVISDNTTSFGRVMARGSGSAAGPAFRFGSEQSLGLYRSAASQLGLSYGQLVVPQGSQIQPPYAWTSENSLGLYRSGSSTIAQSWGTFNLATNSVRLSVRTTGTSLNSTNVVANELAFFVGGASGCSIGLRSGSTIYWWDSSASTKG